MRDAKKHLWISDADFFVIQLYCNAYLIMFTVILDSYCTYINLVWVIFNIFTSMAWFWFTTKKENSDNWGCVFFYISKQRCNEKAI